MRKVAFRLEEIHVPAATVFGDENMVSRDERGQAFRDKALSIIQVSGHIAVDSNFGYLLRKYVVKSLRVAKFGEYQASKSMPNFINTTRHHLCVHPKMANSRELAYKIVLHTPYKLRRIELVAPFRIRGSYLMAIHIGECRAAAAVDCQRGAKLHHLSD